MSLCLWRRYIHLKHRQTNFRSHKPDMRMNSDGTRITLQEFKTSNTMTKEAFLSAKYIKQLKTSETNLIHILTSFAICYFIRLHIIMCLTKIDLLLHKNTVEATKQRSLTVSVPKASNLQCGVGRKIPPIATTKLWKKNILPCTVLASLAIPFNSCTTHLC